MQLQINVYHLIIFNLCIILQVRTACTDLITIAITSLWLDLQNTLAHSLRGSIPVALKKSLLGKTRKLSDCGNSLGGIWHLCLSLASSASTSVLP